MGLPAQGEDIQVSNRARPDAPGNPGGNKIEILPSVVSQKFSGQFKVCLRVGTADPSAPLRSGRDDKLMQGITDSPH